MKKTIMNTRIELNYINKQLKKFYLLQKFFISNIHYIFYLIMQLVTLFIQRISFRLKKDMKRQLENNLAYTRDSLIIKIWITYSMTFFNEKREII